MYTACSPVEDLALAVAVGTQMSVVAVPVEVCFDRDWLDFPCFHTLWRDRIFSCLTEHLLLQRIGAMFAEPRTRCANHNSRRRSVP